jgi:hypothetical protein
MGGEVEREEVEEVGEGRGVIGKDRRRRGDGERSI